MSENPTTAAYVLQQELDEVKRQRDEATKALEFIVSYWFDGKVFVGLADLAEVNGTVRKVEEPPYIGFWLETRP